MSFSPYVLFRRGTLGPDVLTELVPARTWELLDRADALRGERAWLAERIEAILHEAVPVADQHGRRELLRLRRDVHNDRPGRASGADLLPAAARELLRRWTRLHDEQRQLLDAAAAGYPDELDAARKALAAVAVGEDFRRGLQLSGEELHREVMAYAADPFDPSRKPSRRRRAESTITSYACRVALKPSPFGSFTEIGTQPWAAGPHPGAAGSRVSRTRLNIGLLAWMAHELRRLDRGAELHRVRLNNTLRVAAGRATFVSRPVEGAAEAFAADRVVDARASGLVRLLQAELGDGDRTERDLLERMAAAGVADARRTLDKLVAVGLCHRGVGLPDQTLGAAGLLAARLHDLGPGPARGCADVMHRLQEIEDGFAAATADRRAALLAELRELVARFVALTGAPEPAPDALRTAVYEDVGTRDRARGWDPTLLERNRAEVGLFQRLVPVLDDATVEKLGLYRFVTTTYGPEAGEVPLVELYRCFAELPPDAMAAVMSGTGDAHADALRSARHDLLLAVARAADRDPDAAELVLDPAELAGLLAAGPRVAAPWRSMAVRLQVDRGGPRPLAVVNGVTTGHGVFFSRYCDLLSPDGRDPDGRDPDGRDPDGRDPDGRDPDRRDPDGTWDLAAALRRHIAASTPRQADVTATLGLNFNLHPRLTPIEVVYPGSIARPGARAVLTLADLVVRADPARRRLVLVSALDGRPVDLVPMNFLYPAAAPTLYRFLCAFAPTRTYRGGLWDQLERAGLSAARRPRVRLGDLVLDRRTWRLPAAELPALDGLERQRLDALAEFERWRRGAGLPRAGFFRVVTPPPEPGGDVLAEARRWAVAARSARLHKPHFLDTHNPFLLHVLAKQVSAAPGATVVLQECLPAVGAASAEEFFIEHTIEEDR